MLTQVEFRTWTLLGLLVIQKDDRPVLHVLRNPSLVVGSAFPERLDREQDIVECTFAEVRLVPDRLLQRFTRLVLIDIFAVLVGVGTPTGKNSTDAVDVRLRVGTPQVPHEFFHAGLGETLLGETLLGGGLHEPNLSQLGRLFTP